MSAFTSSEPFLRAHCKCTLCTLTLHLGFITVHMYIVINDEVAQCVYSYKKGFEVYIIMCTLCYRDAHVQSG